MKCTTALDESLTRSIEETGRLFGKGGKYSATNWRKTLENEKKGKSMDDGAKLIGLIIVIILAVIFGPLITIWALNGLFSLSITYSLFHWFCALLLGGAFCRVGK